MNALDNLREACRMCRGCGLHAGRTNTVFGEGPADAEVFFVGEGPGAVEDATGRPFAGRSGELLDSLLAEIGLSRGEVYIGNIVKCRPPGNRDPQPEEREACFPYLKRQLELIRPRLVVCLGRISAGVLISPDFKVTKEHGVFYPKPDYEIMGTFHPAALLRTPTLKPAARSDFEALSRKLHRSL